MVPEATLERTEHGSRPVSEGWFVVNVRETRWFGNELGRYAAGGAPRPLTQRA
ncbi:MAG TPA: hypothetical protein VFT35_14645 [Gaiellaceae bacterium]|nr:hypothetical protein [Gaiellaceae bacterium]